MKTRVQKWGNSLAVRIPKSFAEDAQLAQDTLVEVTLQEGKLVIVPISASLTLEELLVGVTEDNLHSEEPVGPAVGGEA